MDEAASNQLPAVDLTPQSLEEALGRIGAYARKRGMLPQDVVAVFEAGMWAAERLRPEALGTNLGQRG